MAKNRLLTCSLFIDPCPYVLMADQSIYRKARLATGERDLTAGPNSGGASQKSPRLSSWNKRQKRDEWPLPFLVEISQKQRRHFNNPSNVARRLFSNEGINHFPAQGPPAHVQITLVYRVLILFSLWVSSRCFYLFFLLAGSGTIRGIP